MGSYLNTDLSGKISKTDIKNNLTSTDTDKPLSAAQGRALATGSANDSTARANASAALVADSTVFTFSFAEYFAALGDQILCKSGRNVSLQLYFRVAKTITADGVFGSIPNGFRPYKKFPNVPLISIANGSIGAVSIDTNGTIISNSTFAVGTYFLHFNYPSA